MCIDSWGIVGFKVICWYTWPQNWCLHWEYDLFLIDCLLHSRYIAFFCILLWLRLHKYKPLLEKLWRQKKINSLLIVSRLTVPSVKAYLYPVLFCCQYDILECTSCISNPALLPRGDVWMNARCVNRKMWKHRVCIGPLLLFSLLLLFVYVRVIFMSLRCVVQPVT